MAAVGEEAQFSCLLTGSKEVVEVTWRKVLTDYEKTVASIGQSVNSDFRNKVKIKDVGLRNSSIVMRNLTEQDGGCYRCVFYTVSEGSLSATTCLRVYELHEPVLHVRESNSPEESVVSCSVTARPAPTVTLTVTQQHLYFYNYSTVTVTNTNNTLTVTKTAVLSGLHGDGTQVGCAVRVGSGPQKEVFLTMTEVKQTPDELWIWLVLVGLVIVLCSLIFWFRNKKNTETLPSTPEDSNMQNIRTQASSVTETTSEDNQPLNEPDNELTNQTPEKKTENDNQGQQDSDPCSQQDDESYFKSPEELNKNKKTMKPKKLLLE